MAMSIRTQSNQANRPALRRLTTLATLAVIVLAAAFGRPANAQQVAIMVNGDPITTYDIEQRMKFNQLVSHKAAVRQEVVDDLINEKLKVQIGRRYKLDITDGDVDNAYADMGRR